jgi:MFS transporter, SP family, inositol transporter
VTSTTSPAAGMPLPRTLVTRRLWMMAYAAGMASYLDAAALLTLSASLPVWRQHFALSSMAVGVLAGGFGFAIAAGALLGGWLGDRWGRERVFAYDLVLFVAGVAIALLAQSGPVLTVSFLLVGLAAGADVPTSLAVISDASPPGTRSRLIALTQVLWITGLLATSVLAFLVSRLGMLGSRLLLVHLLVLGVVAVIVRGVRAFNTYPRAVAPRSSPVGSSTVVGDPPKLAGPSRSAARIPVLTTGAFFVCWNLPASTLGTYGIYFTVTVTGFSQSAATSLAVVALPISLLTAVAFVRLADTEWRDRLYPLAALAQVGAYIAAAVSGGAVAGAMVVCIALYSLSNVFGGEAAYRVWSQLLLLPELRSSGVGLTYAVGRASGSAFLLAVPSLIASNPTGLLWTLSGSAALAAALGTNITRRLLPNRRSPL